MIALLMFIEAETMNELPISQEFIVLLDGLDENFIVTIYVDWLGFPPMANMLPFGVYKS
jgi:hypothetical protein